MFEAGFFSVRSPVRSPCVVAPATPVGGSLLKSVLSAEAKKASSSARKVRLVATSLLMYKWGHTCLYIQRNSKLIEST